MHVNGVALNTRVDKSQFAEMHLTLHYTCFGDIMGCPRVTLSCEAKHGDFIVFPQHCVIGGSSQRSLNSHILSRQWQCVTYGALCAKVEVAVDYGMHVADTTACATIPDSVCDDSSQYGLRDLTSASSHVNIDLEMPTFQ